MVSPGDSDHPTVPSEVLKLLKLAILVRHERSEFRGVCGGGGGGGGPYTYLAHMQISYFLPRFSPS